MNNNTFTYITEFSGLGGSAVGLKAAGGQGLLAIEWDPDTGKTQNAYDHLVTNFPDLAAKGCILNEDICKVSGERILEITGLMPKQLNLFTSSAPCQGFSTSNTSRDANDIRNNLFFASLKHVKVLLPELVLFENVAGMTKGAMRGKYLQITSALKGIGYRVKTWELSASDYGAPQTRPRTWIIGVREDLGVEPSVPAPFAKTVGVRDVLPHLIGIQQGQFNRTIYPSNVPCFTITKTEGVMVIDNSNTTRKPTIEELRVLSTFPADFKFVGSYSQIFARLGNSVLPQMIRTLAEHLVSTVLSKSQVANCANSLHSPLDSFSKQLLDSALAA